MKPADKLDQAIAAAAQAQPVSTINMEISPGRLAQLNLPVGPISQLECFGIIEILMQYTVQSQQTKISPLAGPTGAPIIRPADSN